MESKIEKALEENQFYSGKVYTRGAIGLVVFVPECVIELKEEICSCFTDWHKRFYCVGWTILLEGTAANSQCIHDAKSETTHQ